MPLTERVTSTTTTGVNIYLSADRTPLHYRFWKSSKGSDPVLIYVHGIEGHSLWFDRAATELCSRGINLYSADRAGAGLNRDVSNTVNSVTCKSLLSDLNAFLSVIKVQHPTSDIYLLGNCWGGTLSIIYAAQIENYTPLSGLILSCPAIKTICDVSLLTKLSLGWSYISNSKKQFLLPLTPEMFTKNPAYLEFINDDELRTTKASAHFFIETLKMQYLASQAATKIDLPVLILQAGKDAIVDSSAISKWYERLNCSKNYTFFDTANHSLDFEIDISGFLNAITDWIRE